jgi:hypothetical protein
MRASSLQNNAVLMKSKLPCTANWTLHLFLRDLSACTTDSSSSHNEVDFHWTSTTTLEPSSPAPRNGTVRKSQPSSSAPHILSSRASTDTSPRRRGLWKRLLGCIGASRAASMD